MRTSRNRSRSHFPRNAGPSGCCDWTLLSVIRWPHGLISPTSAMGWGRAHGEGNGYPLQHFRSFPGDSEVKNLPALREVWVWSLDLEDTLEKEMAAHSSILARRIPWTKEPGGLQSMRSPRVRHNWTTNTFTFCNRVHRDKKHGSTKEQQLLKKQMTVNPTKDTGIY